MVALLWTVLSFFGAIPFFMQLYPDVSFTDSLFETVSGLTTTGATIFDHLHTFPRALLYYRQQLNLLGGMGIIVLAVAIMPMLGIGGMQLYRAEATGPVKNTKLKPRIAETAKILWMIYVGLVLLCIASYRAAGMPLFDAVGDAYSTVSTGGFSLHTASFSFYHSNIINIIAIIFMLAGAINFGLHFYFLQQHRLSVYTKNPECVGFLKLVFFAFLITIGTLYWYQQPITEETVINALFTVVSSITTCGLTVTNFSEWPAYLPFFIMIIALIGGCAGSTSGGIKVVRYLLLKAQIKREIKHLIHPQAVYENKLGDVTLPNPVVQSIWAFTSLFFSLVVIIFLLLLATGLSVTTAFGAAIACLTNLGASIGSVSNSFHSISLLAKWILIVAMLAGRLEIFTILVLFSREYWRY